VALTLAFALLTVILGVVALGGVAAALAFLGVDPEPEAEPAPVQVAPPGPAPVAAPVPDPAPAPVPAPVPVEEPDPEPQPAPEPAPTAAPAPRPAPAPAAPAPAPEPAPDAPRIDRAQVSLSNASSIQVVCGDASASGTSSARITDFPAGTCTVRAVYLGESLQTEVVIDRVRGVNCAVSGGALSCP
jgi:outer membrane biosynthesis protein TonB